MGTAGGPIGIAIMAHDASAGSARVPLIRFSRLFAVVTVHGTARPGSVTSIAIGGAIPDLLDETGRDLIHIGHKDIGGGFARMIVVVIDSRVAVFADLLLLGACCPIEQGVDTGPLSVDTLGDLEHMHLMLTCLVGGMIPYAVGPEVLVAAGRADVGAAVATVTGYLEGGLRRVAVAIETRAVGPMQGVVRGAVEMIDFAVDVTHLADAAERRIGVAGATGPVGECRHGTPVDAALDHGVIAGEAMGIVTGIATGAVGAGMSFAGGVMALFVAAAAVVTGAAEGVGSGGGVGLAVNRRQPVGVARGLVHVGGIGGGAVATGADLFDAGLAVAGAGVGLFGWSCARVVGGVVVGGSGSAAMTGIAGRGRLIAPDQGDVAGFDGMTGVAGSGVIQIVDSAVDVAGMGAGIGSRAVTAGAADIGAVRVDVCGMGTAVRPNVAGGQIDDVAGAAGAGSGVVPIGRRVVAFAVAVAVDV